MSTPPVVPFLLHTERLELRAFTESDGPTLAELYADPEVARYIGGDRLTPDSVQGQARTFASVWRAHGYGQSILVDRSTREVVGRVGLHPWPMWDELELGWVLARGSQHRGLAQEAAEAWLDWAAAMRPASYLTAVIDPDNAASIRLAERLGFTFDRADETAWSSVVVYRYDIS